MPIFEILLLQIKKLSVIITNDDFINEMEVHKMARCAICDKARQTGHRISINRSQVSRRANKTWKANIKKIKIIEDGTVKSINICTRCLRSNKVTRAV